MLTHMAQDQWGNTYHNLGAHPRKALLERIGAKRADKMYCDTLEGKTNHVGWIIRGHWLTVYRVTPMEGRA